MLLNIITNKDTIDKIPVLAGRKVFDVHEEKRKFPARIQFVCEKVAIFLFSNYCFTIRVSHFYNKCMRSKEVFQAENMMHQIFLTYFTLTNI